jgi:nickel-dependent lactate racemase
MSIYSAQLWHLQSLGCFSLDWRKVYAYQKAMSAAKTLYRSRSHNSPHHSEFSAAFRAGCDYTEKMQKAEIDRLKALVTATRYGCNQAEEVAQLTADKERLTALNSGLILALDEVNRGK